MDRGGRPPIPTEILRLHDSRHVNTRHGEIYPGGEVPDRPDWLLPEAAKEWVRLSPELIRLRVLTSADWGQFAAYCQNFARWVEAEQFMKEHGDTYVSRDDKGAVKGMGPVPQFGIAQKCLEKMHKFAVEFGLTPSSRARMALASKEEPSVVEQENYFA